MKIQHFYKFIFSRKILLTYADICVDESFGNFVSSEKSRGIFRKWKFKVFKCILLNVLENKKKEKWRVETYKL